MGQQDLMVLCAVARHVRARTVFEFGTFDGLTTLVACTTSVNLCSYAGYAWTARIAFPELRLKLSWFSRRIVKDITAFSAYFFVVDVAVQIGYNLDNVVVGAFLGAAAVGVYAIALRLADYQRQLNTWDRLQARYRDNVPDPELEAAYLQFGRYLMISGSRGSLPMGLQGPWLDGNSPDWMADYHTDINLEMVYWPVDRAGLQQCLEALVDYCLSQLPSWTDVTHRLFNSATNRYRAADG